MLVAGTLTATEDGLWPDLELSKCLGGREEGRVVLLVTEKFTKPLSQLGG